MMIQVETCIKCGIEITVDRSKWSLLQCAECRTEYDRVDFEWRKQLFYEQTLKEIRKYGCHNWTSGIGAWIIKTFPKECAAAQQEYEAMLQREGYKLVDNRVVRM